MIVELSNTEAQELSRYKVQSLFNTEENRAMTCPNCKNRKKVSLILKENLIIGNTESLDYGDVY